MNLVVVGFVELALQMVYIRANLLTMNNTTQKILKSRADLSPYLFHFTKGATAMVTLNKILEDKMLKDVGGKGVICFTEAPLTSMGKLFDIFNAYPHPMYAPYGVALNREKLFELGARPVIYGAPEEKKLLSEEIQWRFEPYIPSTHDFTWLREWRIKDDVVLNPEEIFVITKTQEEIIANFDDLDVESDGDYADGEWHDMSRAYGTRNWKAIPMEAMQDLTLLSDQQVKDIISQQNIGDMYGL